VYILSQNVVSVQCITDAHPLFASLFVAIVVSLSSTTVVANNLSPSDHGLAHGR
jgi:hypothetical protein